SDDLGLGVELDAEAALVITGLRAAQSRDAARSRIAVGARLADGLLELLNHMRRRRQVGIAHAEIDDVGAGVARGRLGAIDLLEHVGLQAADAVKFAHCTCFPRPCCSGRTAGEPLPGSRAPMSSPLGGRGLAGGIGAYGG